MILRAGNNDHGRGTVSRDNTLSRLLLMTVFPVLQMALFGLSCFLVSSELAWAVACIIASGVALNFTIHVCAHELVHYSDRHPLPVWANMFISSVAGLSFDAYRFHHHNHHEHNNGPEDFSRTWRMTRHGPTGYSVWRYAVGWPIQVARTVRALHAAKHLDQPPMVHRRMRYESCSILGMVILLALCSWQFALLYVAMVYFGWSLVSVHNYGQHPPEAPSEATSYASGAWYNRLFFNNGLHYEHHAEPTKPWHELRPDSRAPQITEPHLISAFRRKLNRESGVSSTV